MLSAKNTGWCQESLLSGICSLFRFHFTHHDYPMVIFHRLILWLLIPLCCLSCGLLRAELIAYESFDYAVGTVSTANGGIGWAGGWQDETGNTAAISVTQGLTQGNLGTAGNAMSMGVTSTTRFRMLSSSSIAAIQQQRDNGGDIWLGFVGRNTGNSGKGFLVTLMKDGYADAAANRRILAGTNLFTGNSWSWTNETTVGNGDLSAIDSVNQVFYVLKFHFNSATSSTVTMYLFHGSVADVKALANATYTAPERINADASRQPVFDRLRIGTQNVCIDELRIATSFADLVSTAQVTTSPSIGKQPASASVTEFDDHTFTVQAGGSTPLSYQWKKDGQDLNGQTGTSLVLPDVSSQDAGDYTVEVRNAAGVVTSEVATLEVAAYPRNLTAAAALVSRILPSQANRFRVGFIPPEDGKDVFEVESVGDRIELRGNSGVSVASALNYYLKNYCRCDVSRNGDQLALPVPLPLVSSKVRVVSPHRVRFFYNPCTFGYTSAWWNWDKWQREIDMLALSGVNVAQVTPGIEEVFRRTLCDHFGYTDLQARTWLCMPSHLPWMLLSNMHSFAGPVPDALINARVVLGRRMCDRMRELGMAPMVQGFYGMVPQDFKTRYPSADVRSQGTWAGGFQRPNMLNPTDPMFATFAQHYYAALKDVYGPVRYYAADPFHEGGSTSGINLGAASQAILDGISIGDAKGIWVLEAWGGNPKQEMLDAVDKSRLLVLDLNCSNTESWRSRAAFNNTPWVWCAIQNFGGNTGLSAKLNVIATKPAAALADPARGPMAGIGAVPEGSHTIPAAYEMLMEHGWRSTAPALMPWVRDYARQRYGKSLPVLDEAWDDLLASALNHSSAFEEPHNSIVCARPSLSSGIKARTWSSTNIPYEPRRLADAWGKLLQAAPQVKQSDGYRFDLADVTRQILCDLATRHQRMLGQAYTAGNKAAVHYHGDRILEIIADLDVLCATRKEWLLGTWLADARAWGVDAAEQDLCERNARLLLTTWGVSISDLNDYANREWSGLLSGFYRPRWQQFLTALYSAVDNGTTFNESGVRSQIGTWEQNWVNGHEIYPVTTNGDTIAVSQALWTKYQSEATGAFDAVNHTVGTTWSPSICRDTSTQWTRDVSSVINQPGTWVVAFQYTSGANALQISQVSLTSGSNVVALDRHAGWTGIVTYENRYYLKVTSVPASLTLNAMVNGAGGSDSNGTITITRCDEVAVTNAWNVGDCATARRIWSQDVTGLVNGAGTYQITMNRTGGGSALTVDRVWLEQAGVMLAKEVRDETLDAGSSSQSWSVTLSSVEAEQPVMLKMATGSATTAGSAGTIAIVKVGGAVRNPTNWQEWASEHELDPVYPKRDSDGDGVLDLFEYLLGTNPKQVDHMTALGISSGDHLDFTMAKERVGLDYQVEGSDDLSHWSMEDDLEFLSESTLPGNRIQRSYRVGFTKLKRFYRLNLTVTPTE